MRSLRLALPAVAATVAIVAFAMPAGAASSSISLKDDFFSPSSKTVKHGATVTFVWRGKAPHNVTEISGPSKFTASKTQSSGTFKVKFASKGTYKLHCTIHSGMNLTVKAT